MLTNLVIINDMLAATGTAPVADANTAHPAYRKAHNKLTKEDMLFQARGWWFNRAQRTLKPDITGQVILPSNTLSADPVDTSKNYVIRGGKLYDMTEGTATIGVDVEVEITERVSIGDLPPEAQLYLQAAAVYTFYLDENGGEPKLSSYARARAVAWAALMQAQLTNSDVNFFNGASFAPFRRRGRGQSFL